jgi:hypothetical protein
MIVISKEQAEELLVLLGRLGFRPSLMDDLSDNT